MIDLEKEKQEQELFKQKMLNEHSDYENEEEFEKDKHGDFSWIGTDSDFIIWQMCAEEKQKEIVELKQKLEKLENGEFVALPIIPNDAISIALSYQCFDFIGVAKIYRDLGFDIPKKAEKEQAFFLHKFLILAIKHGNDFIKVFNSETKAMIEALEKDHE